MAQDPQTALQAMRDGMGFPNRNLNTVEIHTKYETLHIGNNEIGVWRYYPRKTQRRDSAPASYSCTGVVGLVAHPIRWRIRADSSRNWLTRWCLMSIMRWHLKRSIQTGLKIVLVWFAISLITQKPTVWIKEKLPLAVTALGAISLRRGHAGSG